MNAVETVEVGVDIGGTFTDVVLRRAGQPLHIIKLPTTSSDPSSAVIEALKRLISNSGVEAARINRFVHGTTVATNAVIERKGASIGVLTTEGFADVLELGRQIRSAMYRVILEPETPTFMAPGARRKGIQERLGSNGEVITPLNEQSVLDAVAALKAEGVQAVAICFLFSFMNPEHEQRARDLIRQHFPELAISISSEVDPAFREYERTLVTAFDAYVKPVVDRYLESMEAKVLRVGVSAPLQVMQSRGGITVAGVARKRPVRLFLSGPAAGVIGGRMIGSGAGFSNIITVDIGGTSTDIALISEGKLMIRSEGLVCGYAVRVPMVDVNPIGAGGGSIAWIDDARSLKVGPHSAGSNPGPACYGRRGREATVTDASVVLGYLDPDYFAGGTIALQQALARHVIEEKIGKPLGLSSEQAALGIHRIINVQMAEGIRLVSIQRGFDPRMFCLVPLGGAGPVHSTALADELGITRIVVPRYPGVLSAIGLLAAPVEHEVSRAFPQQLIGLSLDSVCDALGELDERCRELMVKEGVDVAETVVRHFADVCYVGQSYHLEVPIRLHAHAPLEQLYIDFKAAHDQVYGHSTEGPARIVNLRTVHQRLVEPVEELVEPVEENVSGRGVGPTKMGSRQVLFPEPHGWLDTAIFHRAELMPDAVIEGPAIVEQPDTTIVIAPGWRSEVNARGEIVISKL